MFGFPSAESIGQAFSFAFTHPTYQRFLTLILGLILTMGRRTVSHSLLSVRPLLHGHWSNYHRLYSHARFSMWKLGMALSRQVIALLPRDGPVWLVVDETLDTKSGNHVWAKATHRDPKRSSRSVVNFTFGHQWLVMCVLVRLPGVNRPWALPILCGLCQSPKVAAKLKLRPKPASVIARQMLIRLMRAFPGRSFVLLGDSKVLTHRTACFAQRHADRVSVVGRLRGDANLYGRPAKKRSRQDRAQPYKGRKLPSPAEEVERQLKEHTPTRETLDWYGSGRRELEHVSQSDVLWYSKHDLAVVLISWVCVLGDPSRGLENAFFYSTNLTMTPGQIIQAYMLRWNIEVTFQETRALLGLETTRHWCRQSVLRATPILMCLFSVVTLLWQGLPSSRRKVLSATPCYAKKECTFADALFAVRREIWQAQLRHHPGDGRPTTIPRFLKQTLLWHLAAAA